MIAERVYFQSMEDEMNKIIFCNIMMKEKLTKFSYKVSGDSSIAYDKEVYFPVNGVLARKLTGEDKVKVVLLKKEDIHGNSDKNCDVFKEELNQINASIGASIEYKIISSPHDESRVVQENILKEMVDELVDGVSIYADITFGTKSLPIIVFSTLNFAEKFFNAKIENIVYGKVDFENDGTPKNPELFDMSALFYLNSITNLIECESGEKAKIFLNTLLAE